MQNLEESDSLPARLQRSVPAPCFKPYFEGRPSGMREHGMGFGCQMVAWEYRELIRNLTIVDLKNRYQNTSLGFFWSILSPFLLAFVLYFVFRNLFSQEENFALNLIVGIMVWRFFSVGTITSLFSIVSRPSLVTKVYIPRQILVLSSALCQLIASTLEFVTLIPITYYILGYIPKTFWLYPVAHLFIFFPIYGVGLLLSSLFIFFRDLNQIWDVLLNVLFYSSPIIYPISIVPDYLITLYMFNPITRMVIIYRDLIVLGTLPSIGDLTIVVGFSAGVVLLGSYVFNRLQLRFAEEI
jgi:lipopolysaccharide transport system permease protein